MQSKGAGPPKTGSAFTHKNKLSRTKCRMDLVKVFYSLRTLRALFPEVKLPERERDLYFSVVTGTYSETCLNVYSPTCITCLHVRKMAGTDSVPMK